MIKKSTIRPFRIFFIIAFIRSMANMVFQNVTLFLE